MVIYFDLGLIRQCGDIHISNTNIRTLGGISLLLKSKTLRNLRALIINGLTLYTSTYKLLAGRVQSSLC